MKEEGSIKNSTISKRVGCTPSVLSRYKERLEAKGIVISPSHGYAALALPRFYNVVKDYKI